MQTVSVISAVVLRVSTFYRERISQSTLEFGGNWNQMFPPFVCTSSSVSIFPFESNFLTHFDSLGKKGFNTTTYFTYN